MRLLSRIGLSAVLGLSILTVANLSASAVVVPAQMAIALQPSNSEIAPAAFRGGGRIFIPHGGMHHFNGGFGGPGFSGHRYGRNPGPFLGGLGAGVLLGAPGYDYGYDYDYDYDYGYNPGYNPGYYYRPRVVTPDAAVAYCLRRFKSYDLASRTYLGYDGHRHPCP